MKKILFYSTKSYEKEFFEKFNKDFKFEIKYLEVKLNTNTVSLAKGYDGICCFVHDLINNDVIKELKNIGINVVALRAAGYNNVDLKSAYENKIHILRVPKYSPYSVAEHTIALILCLNRKIHKSYVRTRELNFEIDGLLGFDLFKKTAGIIGTGNIGKIVGKILSKGFGLNVLCYDKNPDIQWAKDIDAQYCDLDKIFQLSDIITLHCPLNNETFHIINENSFSKMKKGVMIINTSRGALIDTKELIKNLKNGNVGYAGLDVYEEEEEFFFEDYSIKGLTDDVLARLLTFPNVLITSHQAFFTKEAMQNIAYTTLKNFKDYFEGLSLENEICYFCGEKKDNCLRFKLGKCFD